MRAILGSMKYFSFGKMKPLMRIALIVVLVGGALFLVLPLVVPGGAGIGNGYTISKSDHISSWSWHGAYADGAQKEADTKAEIGRLKGLIGKKTTPDYDLYVGIASEYELLGDGKSAYNYLSKAISVDPKRGIAYMNMGHLMDELGALTTAHAAFDAAVTAEPGSVVYQAARQDFLIHHTTIK